MNPAEEHEILFPDREVTLSTGEQVTVNEYSFRDGLRMDAFAAPLIADLRQLLLAEPDEDAMLAQLDQLFGLHAEIVMQAIAIATAKTVEWLDALGDSDGQKLRLTWWSVNRDFFLRRLVRPRQATLKAWLQSSPDSSATATAGTT